MSKYNSKIIEENGVSRIEYFNEHWYKVPGHEELLPSTTHIINQVVSKGYGFEEWLKSVGHESNYIVREAQESGSKLHHAIEQLIKGEQVVAEQPIIGGEKYDKNEWKKLNQWVDWMKQYKVEPLASEMIVYDERSAGTLDCIAKINGEIWVLDWKTGNDVHESAKFQVADYFHKAQTGEFKPVKAGIVHIGASNRTFKELNAPGVKLIEVDTKVYGEGFDNIYKLYKLLYPNEKAPTDVYPLELCLRKEVK